MRAVCSRILYSRLCNGEHVAVVIGTLTQPRARANEGLLSTASSMQEGLELSLSAYG